MASDRTIQIDALRKVINWIVDFIEKDLGISEVDLKKDHYWNVFDDDMYELARPEDLGAGSLQDDWEFLLSSAKDKAQQLPIMLLHVAPILQALSQALPSSTSPSESSEAERHVLKAMQDSLALDFVAQAIDAVLEWLGFIRANPDYMVRQNLESATDTATPPTSAETPSPAASTS